MTPVTRPQGPLPARIYWVRRALVLGTAFILVFGLARLLGGGSDGKSEDQAVGVAGETSQSSSTGGADDAGETTRPRRKGSKAKPTRTPLAKPDGPCDAADLTVEADLKRVRANDPIQIPLTVSGTVDACTWTVSNETLALKITSGSDMIWSSQQCPRIEEQDVVVRSAKPATATFEWNGKRSDEECSRTTGWAMPGAYHVVAAPFGGEPSDVQFALVKPRPEKIFKTVRPKPNKSDESKPSTPAEPSETRTPSAPKTRPTTPPSGAVEPNG
ncbi:MAG: hypothetical protein L0H93_08965 [Nocardioides sp.]|nr:hypothetical protein [Nocardioides sp.]